MLNGLRTPKWLALAALTLLVAGAAIGWAAARHAPTAKRTALARASRVRGADNRDLGLSRVVIPAGAKIPLHHHEGTQAAYISKGLLTYHVKSGSVTVRRGQPGDSHVVVVRKIKAGQTGKIHAGEWIVEQPSDHHTAANHGDKKIVIYLATLLRDGAPPSTPG